MPSKLWSNLFVTRQPSQVVSQTSNFAGCGDLETLQALDEHLPNVKLCRLLANLGCLQLLIETVAKCRTLQAATLR